MNKEARLKTLISDQFALLTGIKASDFNLQWIWEDENTLILRAGFPLKPFEKTEIPQLIAHLQKDYPDLIISFESFIKAHQTQLIGKGLRGIKNTIAVASGKGGVGKSTVAVNLAIALSRAGASVGILDADIYGPSIPLMLGKQKPVEIVDDKYIPVNAHGVKAMSIGYLTQEDDALIWRGPMLAKSLLHLIDFTNWGELDYLILDLPPGTGDIQLSLVQKIPLTGAIVVTSPQKVATIDAQKAIQLFEKTAIKVLGLVENMTTHQCSHCGHKEAIFGQEGAKILSDTFKIPLLAEIPLHEAIQRQCDAGNPIAAGDNFPGEIYTGLAMKLAIALAGRPLNYANKFPDIVVETHEKK